MSHEAVDHGEQCFVVVGELPPLGLGVVGFALAGLDPPDGMSPQPYIAVSEAAHCSTIADQVRGSTAVHKFEGVKLR
jgi:hypothetical protein